MRKRNRFLLRFAVSFLAALVLPVTVFTVVFMRDFRNTYADKVSTQLQSELARAGDELDGQLDNFREIVMINSRYSYMYRDKLVTTQTTAEIVNTLSSQAAVNSFIENVAFYRYIVPDRIYTDQGTYQPEYYAKLKMGMENERQLLQLWGSVEDAGWISYQSKGAAKPVLQYIVSVDSDTKWVFTVSWQELSRILSWEDTATMLLAADGTQLCSFVGKEMTKEADYQIHAPSKKGAFELVRVGSEEVLLAEVYSWQRDFIIMVALVLVAGACLVAVLTFYNEKPFRKLRQYFADRGHSLPDSVHGLDMVVLSFEDMETRMQLLEQQRKRERLLLQVVLNDGQSSLDAVKKNLQEEGTFLQAKYYRVLVALAHSEDSGSRVERYLEMTMGEDAELRPLTSSVENRRVFVAGLTQAGEDALEENVRKAHRLIAEDLGDTVLLCVGDRCDKIEDLRFSYKEAIVGIQETGEEQIRFCQSAREQPQGFRYPADELEMLYQALIEADFEKANMLTDRLICFLEQHENSRYLSTSIYYDLLNAYYKARVKLEQNQEPRELDIGFLKSQIGQTTLDKVNHVREQFQDYVESVSNTPVQKDIISQVITFIEENIKTFDLSVGMVADHFDVSISNLSHQFKAKMGYTISSYITQKKLAHAAMLLTETDKSLAEVAELTGYSQTTSFIRKFRQFYGMTPTEFREEHSAEDVLQSQL